LIQALAPSFQRLFFKRGLLSSPEWRFSYAGIGSVVVALMSTRRSWFL
jgi:hypothetical protein